MVRWRLPIFGSGTGSPQCDTRDSRRVANRPFLGETAKRSAIRHRADGLPRTKESPFTRQHQKCGVSVGSLPGHVTRAASFYAPHAKKRESLPPLPLHVDRGFGAALRAGRTLVHRFWHRFRSIRSSPRWNRRGAKPTVNRRKWASGVRWWRGIGLPGMCGSSRVLLMEAVARLRASAIKGETERHAGRFGTGFSDTGPTGQGDRGSSPPRRWQGLPRSIQCFPATIIRRGARCARGVPQGIDASTAAGELEKNGILALRRVLPAGQTGQPHSFWRTIT